MLEKIERALSKVQKPTRYIGNEYGSVHKQNDDVFVKYAFCFPDVYEVGMSHLGMKILYHMLNEIPDVACERVFAPWDDMEKEMRDNNIPLYSLETYTSVRDFDIVGFTLQYEMSYSNILNMLDLAGIPLLTKDRGEGMPFVCAGGPCAYNSEPLADFIDFFVMGEGEEVNIEIIDIYREWKKNNGTRIEFLEAVANVEGVYVPSFYDVSYNEDGTVNQVTPNNPNAKPKIRKRIIKDLDKTFYPEEFVVPFMDIVHDRIMVEIQRGCIHGCRFCQAGMIYRPVRERSKDFLLHKAKCLMESTGYEEISLSSLSTSDYSDLQDFTTELVDITEKKKINLSLPSLRLDTFSMDLLEKTQKVRKSSLTFAPEAGTQRLRDVINKGITEEDLDKSVTLAFEGGYSTVKLYFMIGLPTETMEDVDGIRKLAFRVLDMYYQMPKEMRKKAPRITVSTSTFVPKPFTPFQWEGQDTTEVVLEKQKYLKENIRNKSISYSWHESQVSLLEAVFARGDRKLCKVLLDAHKAGIKFDGWEDFFDFDKWQSVFDNNGLDMDFYARRKREFSETLPWDHIDIGVTKDYLINECEKSRKGITTPDCKENCNNCGAACFGGGICFERK